jgi:hypothetical protein
MVTFNSKKTAKPFVLKQHEKDFAETRELVDADLDRVTGGLGDRLKLSTMTCTGGVGCGDDGSDEG